MERIMTLRTMLGAAGFVLLMSVALCAAPAEEPGGLALWFDFERDLNLRGFPDEWRPVGGPRHPQNIRERLDASERHSGARSFLVEPDGLANVYETERAWRFDPRLSWRLTGYIRTQDVPSTGPRATTARIEVMGFEADGKPPVLLASTVGVTGTAGWTCVTADVPRDETSAVRLIRLCCVTNGTALSGRAWFDDIRFAPRSAIRATGGSPDGYFPAGERRVMKIALDTVLDKDCRLTVTLTDPDGRPAMNLTQGVQPQPGFVASLLVELPPGKPGVYRIHLDLSSGAGPLSSLTRSILCWPSASAKASSYAEATADKPAGKPVFGVYAGEIGRLSPERTTMLLQSRLNPVALDLFGSPGAANRASQLSRLRESPRGEAELVALLGRVPSVVVDRLFARKLVVSAEETTWLSALSSAPANWSEELAAAAKPFAGHASYWQIGDRPDPSVSAPDIRRALTQLRSTLAPLTWGAKLGIVLDGTESDGILAAASGCDFLVLEWSPEIDAKLPQMISRLRSRVGEVWVSVPALKGSAEDLASRMLRAKAAGAGRVLVRSLDDGLLDANGEPTEALWAASTVARGLRALPAEKRTQNTH
jgi:hypothetical protein